MCFSIQLPSFSTTLDFTRNSAKVFITGSGASLATAIALKILGVNTLTTMKFLTIPVDRH